MRKPNLTIAIEDYPSNANIKIVTMDGEADTMTVDIMDRGIMPFINMKEATLVLDLSKLTYTNSLGLAKIIKYFVHKKKHFKIVHPHDYVMEILDITGLLNIMDVYPSVDEAVDSLKNRKRR